MNGQHLVEMALVTCPDCGREISDAAPACIGCGRPMTPSSGTRKQAPAPHSDPEMNTRRRRSGHGTRDARKAARQAATLLGECGACGSDDVRKVSLVYEMYTAQSDSETTATGIGAGTGGLAVGGVSATTHGIQQSELARRLEPPQKRDEGSVLGTGIGALTVLIVLGIVVTDSISLSGTIAAIVIGVLVFVALSTGPFQNHENVRWNAKVYPRELEAWSRSVVCMRCGAVTDPLGEVDTDEEEGEETEFPFSVIVEHARRSTE